MNPHRDLAIDAMTGMARKPDFMAAAGIEMPTPWAAAQPYGALPAMAREQLKAGDLKHRFDLVILFGIGDYPEGATCSTYYDPTSPWYNVFYGAYAIRSYKPDGLAWGYGADGKADFAEFLQVPEIDYNFLTAGNLGCPPEMMCYRTLDLTAGTRGAWDTAMVQAQIPSGLHKARNTLADPSTYLLYGVPPGLRADDQEYQPVVMRGRMFMRRVQSPKEPRPITLVFGTMCPDTPAGQTLLDQLTEVLWQAYNATVPVPA